jgi:hypothetical protein
MDYILADLKTRFGAIRFLEIGICGAGTVRGVYRKAGELQCPVHCAGVDFECYRPDPFPSPHYDFHAGDSMDQWRNIKKEFNLLFVDGCHCVNHSMMDFLNYSPFVVVDGYALFHDTASDGPDDHQGAWPQNHSYAGQPPSMLGVRGGLKKMGLLQGHRSDYKLIKELPSGDGLMGMMLFQKLKPL